MNSSQLVSYDVFKGMILQHTDMKDGIPVHFIASALAGTVATTVCSPADVVKSRVMAREGPGGPMKVLTKSWQKEGPRFLFKGWLPAWSESELASSAAVGRRLRRPICSDADLSQSA